MQRLQTLYRVYVQRLWRDKVSRHAGVAAHKCVYSAADSGKHAESVIGGETSILDAMGGRFGGRGRQAHRRGWDLKAKGALKAWQGRCFRVFH